MTEHAERTEKALAARTVGDLGHLIEDLTPARVNAIVAPAGRSPIRATMSTTRREGPWTVPPVLHASVFLGEAKIDMTHAYFTTPVVTLDTSIIMGEVQLLVPEEINVLDEATHIMSEFKIKGSLDPAPGAPVIIVKGSSVMGSITVKVRH